MADACEASGTAQAVERGLTTCFAKLMKKLALIVASLAGMAGGACAQGQFSAQAGILNSNALHSHARQTNNLEDPFSDAGSTAAAYSFARGELSQDLSTPGGSPSGAEFFDAALPRPAAWEDHSTAFEAAPMRMRLTPWRLLISQTVPSAAYSETVTFVLGIMIPFMQRRLPTSGMAIGW